MGVSLVGISVFLLSLIIFCMFEVSLAGSTRHYHFEVLPDNSHYHFELHIDLFFVFMSEKLIYCGDTDKAPKCDKTVPYKEHGDSERPVSRTSHCGKGGRPSSYQSHQPCVRQHHHSLVNNCVLRSQNNNNCIGLNMIGIV